MLVHHLGSQQRFTSVSADRSIGFPGHEGALVPSLPTLHPLAIILCHGSGFYRSHSVHVVAIQVLCKCHMSQGSISTGLEIEGQMEIGSIGLKMCLHTQTRKGPPLGDWVSAQGNVSLSFTMVGESLAKTLERDCRDDRQVIDTTNGSPGGSRQAVPGKSMSGANNHP